MSHCLHQSVFNAFIAASSCFCFFVEWSGEWLGWLITVLFPPPSSSLLYLQYVRVIVLLHDEVRLDYMHFPVNWQTQCVCVLLNTFFWYHDKLHHQRWLVMEINLVCRIVWLIWHLDSYCWWVCCISWCGLYISAFKVFFEQWIVRPLLTCHVEVVVDVTYVFFHNSNNASVNVRLLAHRFSVL